LTTRKQPASPETIQARFGQSWDDVARLADMHTRTVQAWLSSRAPQAARFDGLGVTATSTGLPVRLLNLGLGSHYPPETRDETISTEIEKVKTFFTNRNVPWYWWIGPHTSPANIGERLAQHGLVDGSPGLPALAAPLPTTFPALNQKAHVWQANSRADLEAASTIRRIAFGFPEGAALTYFEDMAEDWLRGDPARLYLVGLDDGPPVAIGALIMGAGIPGIYIMATLPEWGRQGLGKAVMAHMLSESMAEGHSIIALTAGVKGYPLYRQFGFEHIFDYKIFMPAPDE